MLIIPFMQGIHIGPTTSLWLLRVLYSCCLCKNNIYVVCFQQTWMHHTYDENMIRPQQISWINLGICVNRITRIQTSKRIHFQIYIYHERLIYILLYKYFCFWQPIQRRNIRKIRYKSANWHLFFIWHSFYPHTIIVFFFH